MADSLLIFVNPHAGRGLGVAASEAIAADARRLGMTADIWQQHPLSGPAPVENLAAVVAIGGDGTIKDVVGYLQKWHRLDVPVLVVPGGTANLMAKNLRVGWRISNVAGAVEAVARGKVVVRDLAEVTATNADGSLATMPLLVVAGAGIDGQIVHDLHARRTGPIRYASYALPMIRAFLQCPHERITVTVDGRVVFGPAKGMAMVANCPEHGIGFRFLPEADPTDGLLDVIAFEVDDSWDGLLKVPAAAAEILGKLAGSSLARGREIRVEAERPLPVQADGDPLGYTTMTCRVTGQSVRFVVA